MPFFYAAFRFAEDTPLIFFRRLRLAVIFAPLFQMFSRHTFAIDCRHVMLSRLRFRC